MIMSTFVLNLCKYNVSDGKYCVQRLYNAFISINATNYKSNQIRSGNRCQSHLQHTQHYQCAVIISCVVINLIDNCFLSYASVNRVDEICQVFEIQLVSQSSNLHQAKISILFQIDEREIISRN